MFRLFLNADNGANAADGAAPVEGATTETVQTPVPAVAVPKKRVSADELIAALQKANSIKEVSQLTGLTENNIHQRRHQLALKGIKVKQYAGSRGGNRLDVAKLQELAASTLPEGAAVFVATTRPKVETPAAAEGAETAQATESTPAS